MKHKLESRLPGGISVIKQNTSTVEVTGVLKSISCEIPGWMNPKLESRFLGEITTASGMQMIPF